MPFDYEAYQKKCDAYTTEQLQKEWENYTRQISGGATSTATSVLFSPLTAGISLIGLGLSGPRIHNARKKRAIIEAGLQQRGGAKPVTRKRDVVAPMAIAGTLGTITLGLAGPGADLIGGAAAEHGAQYMISHAALDGAGAALENKHDQHHTKTAHAKLQKQQQAFQQQYVQHQPGQATTQTMQQQTVQVTLPQGGFVSPDTTPVQIHQQQYIQQQAMQFQGPVQQPDQPPNQALADAKTSPPIIPLASRPTQATYVPPPPSQSQHAASPAAFSSGYKQQDIPQQAGQTPPPVYSETAQPLPDQQQILIVMATTQTTTTQSAVVEKSGEVVESTEVTTTVEATVEVAGKPDKVDDGPDMHNFYPGNVPSLFPLFSRPSNSSNPESVAVPGGGVPQLIQDPYASKIEIAELSAEVEDLDLDEEEEDEAVALNLTPEQEIALLKARILQLEIEKRLGIDPDQGLPKVAPTLGYAISSPEAELQPNPLHIRKQSPPTATATRQQNNPADLKPATLSYQQYPPSAGRPASNSPTPAQNSRPAQSAPHPTIVLPHYQLSQANGYPPPPPSPHQVVAPKLPPRNPTPQRQSPPGQFTPTPAPDFPPQQQQSYAQYQPQAHSSQQYTQQQTQQQYAQEMPINHQYNPQAQYNRQDSGYFSHPPSSHSSYNPMSPILSPNTTGYSTLSSLSYAPPLSPSACAVSPVTPHSQPAHPSQPTYPVQSTYFAPPPSQSSPAGLVADAKDFLNNRLSRYVPELKKFTGQGNQQHQYPSVQVQQGYASQGNQGWQWGSPAPNQSKGHQQPNYGPPPPVPSSWRG